MGNRLDLHSLLKTFTSNVYYQPPEEKKMQYPCIRYARYSGDTQFADNMPYGYRTQYQIMVIDRDPDSPLLEKIANLPLCRFDRHYTADNLNHDVYHIYY